MNSDLKNESGMTLVESLIAIVILMFGLLAMAQALAFSVIASKTYGRDSGLATAAAHDKMEELISLSFNDTVTNLTMNPPYATNGSGLTAGGGVYPSTAVAGYSDCLTTAGSRTASLSDTAYTRQWQIINESAASKRIIVSVRSNKSFRYGVAPSTTLITRKTP